MSSLEKTIETAQNSQRYLKLAEKHARQAADDLQSQIEDIERRVGEMMFTQREAAAFARCDVKTVWRHQKAGKLKSLLITDVQQWKREYKPGNQ